MSEAKQEAQQEAPVCASDVDVVSVKPHKAAAKRQEYRVLCCGNSGLDLLLIPLCLAGVYALAGALFALCTHAVLQTDDTNTALWLFFGTYVCFISMLGLVLATTAYNRKMLKAHEDDELDDL
ncbi:hypothetical protein BBJ28_00009147 [Nothophytophthora sp. Chile5]|nr:hypothetical protein BBJ28_00009147 [Nothophytophthora sp. Chile5]